MKQLFLQLFFSAIIINSIFATNPTYCIEDTMQDIVNRNNVQKKSITIGIPLTHFAPKKNINGLDYKVKFISPGVEAQFNFPLSNSTNFITGLSYQYNKITYWENSPDIRTITNELSIPLLISLDLFKSTTSDMELTFGFYLGQYFTISNNLVIFGHDKKNYAKLFSTDDFIGDIYIAMGKKSIFKKIPIGFDLFFRYRLKEHQIVNSDVSRSFYGIKLKYEFNL